jgi:hypothetical protein
MSEGLNGMPRTPHDSCQINIESFETDWRIVKRHLEAMASNPVLVSTMYIEFTTRIRSLESLVLDVSDCVRSDKD